MLLTKVNVMASRGGDLANQTFANAQDVVNEVPNTMAEIDVFKTAGKFIGTNILCTYISHPSLLIALTNMTKSDKYALSCYVNTRT